MDFGTCTDINTFASPPTQYEVKNWLLGHAQIVQSRGSKQQRDGSLGCQRLRQDGTNREVRGGADLVAQRHSAHLGFPLEKDKQERARLKKGHRNTRLHGHHHHRLSQAHPNRADGVTPPALGDGLQKGTQAVETKALAGDCNGQSRHGRTLSQRRMEGQGHRFSSILQGSKKERSSWASSAASGDTLVDSASQHSSPPNSPSCMRFSTGSISKPRYHVSSSPHSSPAPAPPGTGSCSKKELQASATAAAYLSPPGTRRRPISLHLKASGHDPSTSTSSRSRLSTIRYTAMEDPKPKKALNGFKSLDHTVEPDQFPREDEGMPQPSLRPQRSFAKLGRMVHIGRSRRNVTDSSYSTPRSPSEHSPHRLMSPQHRGHASLGKATAYSPNCMYTEWQRQQVEGGSKSESLENAESEEDPDPTILGSLDYHNFLGDASGRKDRASLSPPAVVSPAATIPKANSSGINKDSVKYRTPKTAVKTESFQDSVLETPTHQQKHKVEHPSLLERRLRHSRKRSEETGVAVPLPPHHLSIQTPRGWAAQTRQEAKTQRLTDVSNRDHTVQTPQSKESLSLKASLTTPDTARTVSGPSPLILIGGSPFASTRSTSQCRLPRTNRPIPTSIATPFVPVYQQPLPGRSVSMTQTPKTPRLSIDPATGMALPNGFPEDSPTFGVMYPQSGPQPPQRGPAGYVSWRNIDPEKLKPFIGPLLPQRPPPTGPPPPRPTTRAGRYNMADSVPMKPMMKVHEPLPPSLPKSISETMTPVKPSAPSIMSKASTAGRAEKSQESSVGPGSIKRLRNSLRQKVSTLFGEEPSTPSMPRTTEAVRAPTSISTYRPISMNSLDPDPDSHSFSDIFDDVFNAARDSAPHDQRSTGTSFASGRPSVSVLSEDVRVDETAPREHAPRQVTTQIVSRDEVADRLAARLGMTDSSSRAAILAALSEVAQIAPPLTSHPAIRGDLPLQARIGMIEEPANSAGLRNFRSKPVRVDSNAAWVPTRDVTPASMAGLHVPPLNVGRQRPTQVAVSTRPASRSVAPAVEPLTGYTTRTLVTVPDVARGQGDVDLTPTFDRSVDLTWYRYAKKSSHRVMHSRLPNMAKMFDAHSTVFMVKYSCGRESRSKKYNKLRRFAYYELDGEMRFKIMEKLLEDYLPGKPILLNHARQASPAWPDDAFARLWQVLGPLQNVLTACPRLRADVMTALFITQPFHVIFSPFVKPITQPLPTKWLLKYVYFMQDLRVELDMTKLGFGQSWQATGLSTRLWDIGNLVHELVEEILRRDPQAHPLAQLTIHCRRFFGYRQGEDPHHGDVTFYKSPAGADDEQKPSTQPEGQPWNYGRKSASFPPSANNPYSGHRRHHTGGSDRVPFLHEGHMSIADAFYKLAGRVWSVRIVGMSENWAMRFYNFWPKAEYAAIPQESFGLHIDRYTPSRHSYAAPGHAMFLDYGIRAGLHRFPPLSDSEPMVCVVYDGENDVFLEVGSGNILTVKENGVEVIARSENPPIPRGDLPYRGALPISLDGLTVAPSRIPGPVGRRVSPTMQAMRKGTPKKALQLLGIEGGDDDSEATPSASPTLRDDEDDVPTPTTSRAPSAAIGAARNYASVDVHGEDDQRQVSTLAAETHHSSSTPLSTSRRLSSKKSYLGLMSGDRQKPAK